MRYNRLIPLIAAASMLLLSCSGRFGVIVPDFEEYDGIGAAELSSVEPEIHVEYNFTSAALPVFAELTEQFNETNEFGITVSLLAGENRADAADIVICSPPEAASRLREGTALELSPLIMHPVWGLESGRSIFYPAARRQTDYFDFALRITSVPLIINTNVMLVNDLLLAEAGAADFPDTWFGFEWLLSRAGRRGVTFLGMNLNSETVVSVITARGGSILKPGGFSYSLFNPVVNRSLRFLREMEERGVMIADRTDYLNQTAFAFGRLPSVYTSLDGIRWYSELIDAASPELGWSADLLPSRRPGKTVVINCSSAASITDGVPERELSSWLFIRWLTEVQQQVQIAGKSGYMPAVREAAHRIIREGGNGMPRQWYDAIAMVDDSRMEVIPGLHDYTLVATEIERTLERIDDGHWIWLENLKLDRLVKKNRREASEIRAGRR